MRENRGIIRALIALPILWTASLAAQPVDQKQGERPKQPVAGYLAPEDRPDSLLLIPPPPASGSPSSARDMAAAQAAISQRDTPRWIIAKQDAELTLPKLFDSFSCAMGTDLTALPTPKLSALLMKSLPDLAYSTFAAKDRYRRARPFTVDKAPTCTPEINDRLSKDGSYPSGHSAIGWGAALLLAEMAHDKANALLARGRAFGQSRVICNVHWLSDVEAGRVIASAAVARLHANVQFRQDLQAAAQELTEIRKRAPQPRSDCAVLASALASG